MTNRKKELTEILKQLEENGTEAREILNRTPLLDTGRSPKPLYRIPPDMDFTVRDGHTEYAVTGHFDSAANEGMLSQILRMLKQRKS